MMLKKTIPLCSLLVQTGHNDRIWPNNLPAAWQHNKDGASFRFMVTKQTLIMDYEFYLELPSDIKTGKNVSIIIVDDYKFLTVGESRLVVPTLPEAFARADSSKVFICVSPSLYMKVIAAKPYVAEVIQMKTDKLCKSASPLPELNREWYTDMISTAPATKSQMFDATFFRHWRLAS
ncbi:MAG: hypothetical protein JWL92_541 [Candidatus Nomurabacteria bacterium]|nr:hypothetical protein [Candidatus Nomurabacteria bacterium]